MYKRQVLRVVEELSDFLARRIGDKVIVIAKGIAEQIDTARCKLVERQEKDVYKRQPLSCERISCPLGSGYSRSQSRTEPEMKVPALDPSCSTVHKPSRRQRRTASGTLNPSRISMGISRIATVVPVLSIVCTFV